MVTRDYRKGRYAESSKGSEYRARSRSISPDRRRRDRSRSASPKHEKTAKSSPSRREQYRQNDRAPSPDSRSGSLKKSEKDEDERGRTARRKSSMLTDDKAKQDDGELEDADGDTSTTNADEEMMKMMGFANFGTTKGKKVDGANASGASKVKKSEYRQYMNREGGFNRNLSPPPNEKRRRKR